MEGSIEVIPKERKMRSVANKILPFVILFDGYVMSKNTVPFHGNVAYFICIELH